MESETTSLPENNVPENSSAEDLLPDNSAVENDEEKSAAEPSTCQEDKGIPQNEGEDKDETSAAEVDKELIKESSSSECAEASAPEDKGPSGGKRKGKDNVPSPDSEKDYSEVAHWCRPCRTRIEPPTEENWKTHAELETHKKNVVETKEKIAEKKKTSGKTDKDEGKNEEEEIIDQATVGQWCKICKWFVSPHIGWSYHVKDRRHKKNASKKGLGGSGENMKTSDKKSFTCVHCEAKFTYQELCSHLAKDHVHRLLNPTEAKTSRIKGNQSNTSATFKLALKRIIARKEPMIGLDFITEYQRKPFKQFFICDLCHNMLTSSPPLLVHLTSVKHRSNYWKCFASDKYEVFKKKGLRGAKLATAVQRQVAQLQKIHGRGKMNVLKGAKGASAPRPALKDSFGNRVQKRSRDWDERDDDYMSSKRPYFDYEDGPEMNPWMAPNTMMRSQEPLFPSMMDQFQFSPSASSQMQFQQNMPEPYGDYRDMTTLEKFKLIEKLFDFPISTKSQESVAANIVNTLKKKLLQYKILNIPASVQDVLAKRLFGEDEGHNLESIHGLDSMDHDFSGGPSGMSWGREGLLDPNPGSNMSSSRSYGSGNMKPNHSGYRYMDSFSDIREEDMRRGDSKFLKSQQSSRSGWGGGSSKFYKSQQSNRSGKNSYYRSGYRGKSGRSYN